MNCEWVATRISWYLYNELDDGERGAVDEHLETCQACAGEMERERAFLAKLDARKKLEPSNAMLAESRHDLMRSIYRAERLQRESGLARNPWQGLREAWFSMRVWWQPAVASCLLALGFFGGWWVRSGRVGLSPSVASFNPSEGLIANISAVNLEPKQGQVQISFDEIQRQTLRGSVDDPQIQKLLIYAAKHYGNPGVRLDTIDILKERAEDKQVRDTLLDVVGHDENSGVRLKALEGLKPYARDAEVRRALIGVLTRDPNPGMRVQAIDMLMMEPQDHSLVGVLQGVADREKNNYVRMRSQSALRDMNASAETF
jgi:Putative zinc-finger/HEAT repeats